MTEDKYQSLRKMLNSKDPKDHELAFSILLNLSQNITLFFYGACLLNEFFKDHWADINSMIWQTHEYIIQGVDRKIKKYQKPGFRSQALSIITNHGFIYSTKSKTTKDDLIHLLESYNFDTKDLI